MKSTRDPLDASLGQKPARQKYRVRAVQRALSLLRVFLTRDCDISASEASKAAGLDPGTGFRMLLTLESEGFVQQDPSSGRYHLGVICLELGSRFLVSNDIRRRSLGTLETLRDQFGESVHLAILEGDESVYLEKLAGLHPIGIMSSRVGSRSPAHCTAVGKVLLAQLADEELRRLYPNGKLTRYTDHTITNLKALRRALAGVRMSGYALDEEEHERGVKCVAVPTFDHKGMSAAISISGPTERMNAHIDQDRLIETLMDACTGVSVRRGWGRGVDQLEEPLPIEPGRAKPGGRLARQEQRCRL